MANSKYDYHKDEERLTDLRFNRDTYIIVRIDGDKFHNYCTEHNFHKPNDKRALDLMVESAKHLMKNYKGHIPLAYGHSDEFSFLIKNTSNILSRRVFKITSMLPVVFATFYNNNWDRFFSNPTLGQVTKRKYDAWFDARPKEYANYKRVIDYFKWRQIDCHINNLYNTTLHALTGRYIKHELIQFIDENDDNYKQRLSSEDVLFSNGLNDRKLYKLKRTPIRDWITESNDIKFFSSKEATEKLSGTVSSEKHDIMFLQYKINYNNELEQFKKGTIIIDTQKDYNGKNNDESSIKHFNVDITKSDKFWQENSYIFEDYPVLASSTCDQ